MALNKNVLEEKINIRFDLIFMKSLRWKKKLLKN